MYKNQKIQLNVDRKEITSKTLEAAAEKLQTIQLAPKESYPSLKKINQTSSQGNTTKQVPLILLISETTVKSNLVSKNNHRTPIRSIVPITEDLETPDDTKRASVRKNNRGPIDLSKISENGKVDLKQTNVEKSSHASSRASTTEKVPAVLKTPQPDPTVCTCVDVKPAPIVIPQKEAPNVPKYRWIAVKSETLKTEAENAIRPLLPTIGPPNYHTTTNKLRKPRLCPYCWNKVLEKRQVRQQKEEQRRREIIIAEQSGRKRKTIKPGIKEYSSNRINNRFGNLLDEASA